MKKIAQEQNKFTSNLGYTLVELLLVIGLIALSVGVTSDILLNIVRSYGKTQVLNELEQSANFVSLKLEKELRNANDATVGSTASGPYLRISPRDTPTQFTCYRVNTTTAVIQRAVNSNSGCSTGTFENLSVTGIGNVRVSCIGSCFTASGTTPKIINIALRFTQASGVGSVFTGDIEIVNTIVIRQTYE